MKFFNQYLMNFKMLFGGLLLAFFLVIYWHWLAYQSFLKTPIIATDEMVLTISRGESINSLAKKWQRDGVISNQYYFRFFCFIYPQYKSIKAGEYRLTSSETPISLLAKIVQGKSIQYSFTIIEGMNQYDVINLVKNNPYLRNDLDFESEALKIAKALEIPIYNSEASIEGWLFPDTYHFSRQESALSVLKRAVSKMKQVLENEWQARSPNLPYQNAYQALIMASIIEKETGIASERDKIAGVFVRRLQKKMKLGTDPTVIYGIGPEFNGDITYKDLRTATPYNTYIIKGLPPTPISMPGRESIHAALHPAEGDTLYFVADGSGGHYFSRSLEEHNKAVDRYIRKKK